VEILSQNGYSTFMAGKNHLPDAIADHFDEMHTLATYQRYLKEKGLEKDSFTELEKKNFMAKASGLPEEEHDETWTANQSIEFIKSRRDKDNPFFMWISFHRPHAPHTPPANLDDLYDPDDIEIDWEEYEAFENSRLQNRPMIEDFWKVGSVRHDPKIFQKAVCRYMSLITMIDKNIGRILDTLKETGLDQETLIFFSSDHGDWAGKYGQLGKNLPAYDPLLRIPFIWYDPTRPGDGGRCVNGLCSNVDLMPTLLERLGLDIPPTVQGDNILPHLDGFPLPQREAVFAETAYEKTIRTREWKLTYFVRHPERGQLFKMGSKPDEITNYWDDPAYSHIKQDLLLKLMEWIVRCEQPHNSCRDWETQIDTRWYNWLNRQPRDCEIQLKPQPKNEH
jgi:arylsulfatase A-like enzyme